jgi:hypothetical protein
VKYGALAAQKEDVASRNLSNFSCGFEEYIMDVRMEKGSDTDFYDTVCSY